ncbi:hypothetical protein P7C70_g7902, partial [Phenoliferia sp. Uapishka_3]
MSGIITGFYFKKVPVYQSEISPAEHRGQLACIEFTLNIVGYASSVVRPSPLPSALLSIDPFKQWIDYFSSFIESDYSWRFPLSVQCAIGAILAIGSLIIPESPRWLLDQDRDEEGMQVLVDLLGDGDVDSVKAKDEWKEIKKGITADRSFGDRTYKSMWRRYKYRVLIAMSAQAFAQLNGINVISYYAPLVFESAGWIGRDAILMTGVNGIIYVLSTIPTWYLVDIWGRVPILLSGALVMATTLSSVGLFLYLDKSYTPVAVVVSVIAFNAAHGYSWGPIPWLYPPEILPLAFRVKGVSISTVGEATPILQAAIQWKLYFIHAFLCLCSFVVVYFAYPETMGIPLEEMDALFGDSSHRDLETAPLLRTPATSADPPSLRKRASYSRRKAPQNFGALVKGWFGLQQTPAGAHASRANCQNVGEGGSDAE